jgi:hypothetical protein
MKLTPNLRNLRIRKLRVADYDVLIKIWKKAKLSYRPYGRDSLVNIKQQIKQSYSIYLVAELDGKMIGAVLGTHDGRKGWINRLAVLPRYIENSALAECWSGQWRKNFTGKGLVSLPA